MLGLDAVLENLKHMSARDRVYSILKLDVGRRCILCIHVMSRGQEVILDE